MDIFNILPVPDQRYNTGTKRLANMFDFEKNAAAPNMWLQNQLYIV